VKTKKRVIVGVIFAGIVFLPFLGGSAIWMLGGAHQLDIEGLATVNNRPVETIRLGKGWSYYGGDPGGNKYSAANQITPQNVNTLKPAWLYKTGDLANRPDGMQRSATEGTPILVGDQLIFCTPFNEVIAIDAEKGSQTWRFDPEINLQQRPANSFVCRGVTPWQSSGSPLGEDCVQRILMGTNDARLIALDALTGKRCSGFGNQGEVVIDPGMELLWPGEFQITSPPVIVGNTVIVGSAIGDNARVVAPSGSVRAFDVISGRPLWDFDPIPRRKDNPAIETWKSPALPKEGHANVWAPMSVDIARGLVFLPTSSPSPDFFGGLRPGDNRHANSVVALDVHTGKVVWSFQTVHHDVWDYDLPAQPGLYTIWQDDKPRDVVAQVTKTGMLFVLDRDTGEPVLAVEERAVPQSGVTGEVLSPTQPFPVKTPPIVPHELTSDDAFGITWFDKNQCRKKIAAANHDGIYTPPSERGTLVYPFTGGGANWGGAAFDPSRNLLVINMSNLIHHVQLIPEDEVAEMEAVFHDQEVSPQTGAPFGMKRELLISALELPCNKPPWGVLAGIDLVSGDIVWRKALGTVEDLGPGPALQWGTPNFGGPIITAGGLVFIGAAMDNYLRAFDVNSGEELWQGRIPAGGQATPMTYRIKGRQYVVIYSGGNAGAGTKLGDSLVAFALPEK